MWTTADASVTPVTYCRLPKALRAGPSNNTSPSWFFSDGDTQSPTGRGLKPNKNI